MPRKGPTGLSAWVRAHDEEECPYCGTRMSTKSQHRFPTRDHVVPQALGGRIYVAVCRACNEAKGDKHPKFWFGGAVKANPKQFRRIVGVMRRAGVFGYCTTEKSRELAYKMLGVNAPVVHPYWKPRWMMPTGGASRKSDLQRRQNPPPQGSPAPAARKVLRRSAS